MVLLVAILTYAAAYGQDPYYTTINKSTGLPSNSVYEMFQDSKGFVWIASDEGLTRYDGYEFKTYTNSAQSSRAGNGIEEDKYGRVWYKTFDGYLYFVENDTLKAVEQERLIGNAAFGLFDDRIITIFDKGINILDVRSSKVVKTIPICLTNLGAGLHYKDYFYLSLMDTLVRISADGVVERYAGTKNGIMAGAKNGIAIGRKGASDQLSQRFYTLTVQGKTAKQVPTPEVTYIHGIGYCDNKHWLFTPNGVWGYDENGKNINDGRPLYGAKSISSVMKDRDGNYWFGTLDEGILFVPDLETKVISINGSLPNVFLNDRGTLYAATKDGSIYGYDLRSGRFEKKFSDKVRHEVRTLVADTANNRFVFATQDFIIADGKFKVLQTKPHAIKDIAVIDRKYYAFAASGVTGLYRVREDIESPWDSLYAKTLVNGKSDFIHECRARVIEHVPQSNIIYSGSNNGLYKITTAGITEIREGGKPVYIRACAAFGGLLYMITVQNKLCILDSSDNMRPVQVGERSELLYSIRRAGNDLFLFASSGIRKLDKATGQFPVLNIRPGIRSEEINDLEVVGDKLMIASDRGMIVIDKNNIDFVNSPPALHINSVLVNGVKADAKRLASLSYQENDIGVNYSILSFSTASHVELQYKINGGKWQSAPDATRALKLASLSPGEYEVSFRLLGYNGRAFPQSSLLFSISKPFWTLWWFWCYCFMGLSACVYVFYVRQTNQLKRKNALAVEKMELEKNLRNSMLTSIRAQMNPHFFYNALNTIQSFIFSDEKRNASTYLVKLSKLTRMILEMSEKETISLDEETEALKLYLELEKMRFSNDFNYEIRIGKEVDGELIKIPSMIVQPYIENAVKHGLLHKKGFKNLLIEFEKTDGILCITIDDNGIGREKAEALNQAKKEKHQPFSTNANSKRIELLNKERGKSIGIVFIDKIDTEGQPAGTTVIISIPLN